MAIVQFRVDDDIKKKASELYESLGIDLSTALRSFLRRSIVVGGFPYPMTINGKVEGVAISPERENEVKELLKKIDQIEFEEVKEALGKSPTGSDEDEYGRLALKYINKQIKLAREERRAGDDLLRNNRH